MSCNINIIGYSSQLTFISKQYVLWLEGIPRTIILFEFPNYLTNVLNFNEISDAIWSLVIFMCVKLCVTIFAKKVSCSHTNLMFTFHHHTIGYNNRLTVHVCTTVICEKFSLGLMQV